MRLFVLICLICVVGAEAGLLGGIVPHSEESETASQANDQSTTSQSTGLLSGIAGIPDDDKDLGAGQKTLRDSTENEDQSSNEKESVVGEAAQV